MCQWIGACYVGYATPDNARGWRKRALIRRVIADQIIFIASIEPVKSVVPSVYAWDRRRVRTVGRWVGHSLIWRRNWTGWQFPSIHLTCDMIQKRSPVVTSSIASSVAGNHRPGREASRESRRKLTFSLCQSRFPFLSAVRTMRVTRCMPMHHRVCFLSKRKLER